MSPEGDIIREFQQLFHLLEWCFRFAGCRITDIPARQTESLIVLIEALFQECYLSRRHCQCCQYLRKLTHPKLLVEGRCAENRGSGCPLFAAPGVERSDKSFHSEQEPP